jgi:phospholipase D1/2
VADRLVQLLERPDGPEIVILVWRQAIGWLERFAMGSNRDRLLRRLAAADRHDRLRAYWLGIPDDPEGEINLHAKLVIVDDLFVRIGSSNLNNRSLGFDTECDLAVEVRPDAANAAEVRSAIVALRNDLIAEHLGVAPARIVAALKRSSGSLVAAIEALRSDGRSLVLFEPPALNTVEEHVLGESAMLDPERPASRWRILRRHLPGLRHRRTSGDAGPAGH